MTGEKDFPPELAMQLFGEPLRRMGGQRISVGPISFTLEGMALRWIEWSGVEVLRGIAFVVRDRNWGTFQPDVRTEAFADRPGGVLLRLAAHISEGASALDCRVEIQVSAGMLEVSARATSHGGFHTNRTGLVVLHPAALAASAARVEHCAGGVTEGRFPRLVSPHQPFFDVAAIEHEAAPGVAVRVGFRGDVFEMEDQRNWSDASFKTYNRPLALPYPYTIADGETVAQTLSVAINERSRTSHVVRRDVPRIEVTSDAAGFLPRLGIGGRSYDYRASDAERERLAKLRPSLLMLEAETLDASTFESYAAALKATAARAAIMLRPTTKTLATLRDRLSGAGVTTPELALATSDPAMLACARGIFPGSRIGAGTDAFFAEFNRNPPPPADFLFWTVNPTVHAMDDASVMETLSVLGDQAATARARHPEAALWCGPVTLRMRFNPNATASLEEAATDEPPAGVDARQRGLLAAAFTLGQISAWAEAGLETLVLYAPFGPRGLIERFDGSAVPRDGMDGKGAVYPAYHVLAGLAARSGGPLARVRNEAPERVIALATPDALWLANRTADVVIVDAPGRRVRLLDSDRFVDATRRPEGFWERDLTPVASGRLPLPPYAVARLLLE